MKKMFLCLANSYKDGNRCIAGVEIKRNSKGFEVILDSWGHPVWFRPINRTIRSGAIPNEEAARIRLFDIIEVDNIEPCPEGAQQENHFYSSLRVVEHIEPHDELLRIISYTKRKVIFGDTLNYISHAYYSRLDYSILMLRASDVQCYIKTCEEKQQTRMCFSYNNQHYDFPITDPEFKSLVKNDIQKVNSEKEYYLTLSLGIKWEDNNHYKLVAAVIPCSTKN